MHVASRLHRTRLKHKFGISRFSCISDTAKINRTCAVANFSVIDEGCVVGNRVSLQNCLINQISYFLWQDRLNFLTKKLLDTFCITRTPKNIRTTIHLYNVMSTILFAFLFLLLIGAGTSVGVVLAQNMTTNQSGNMNSSTLELSGNLTNASSTIISNTT